jgi:2-polyprenyl-3-methyl-5-hydroxy-6-metoxy-1,4-benzoquinol methylase
MNPPEANRPTESGLRVWRRCPVCGTERGEPHLQKGPLRIVRCSRCGMLFANPVEPRYLEGSVYEDLAQPYYLTPEKLESDYAPVRFKRELRLFRSYCRGGAVLDVGCSTGSFLHQLQKRRPGSYRVLGVDVSGPALDYAERQGVPVLRSAFVSHDFGAEPFDAITFWAVLEHLSEPRRFLNKAATLLRPGGHCFLLVPNMGSLAVRYLGSRYRYIMPEHLNYFSRETLCRLLDREPSLRLRFLRTTHFNPIVIWQDRRRPGFVAEAERARLLRRTTAWKQSWLMTPSRSLYALAEWSLSRFDWADNLAAVLEKIPDTG